MAGLSGGVIAEPGHVGEHRHDSPSAPGGSPRLPHFRPSPPPSIERGDYQGGAWGVGIDWGNFLNVGGRTAFFLLAQTPHPTSGLAVRQAHGSLAVG